MTAAERAALIDKVIQCLRLLRDRVAIESDITPVLYRCLAALESAAPANNATLLAELYQFAVEHEAYPVINGPAVTFVLKPESYRALVAALESAAPGDAAREPIAWMYVNRTGTWIIERERSPDGNGWTETPLYAAPSADKGIEE